MKLLDDPIPFTEALKALYGKEPMPTDLSSDAISQLSAEVRARSLFSARTTYLDYLQGIGTGLEKLLQGTHNVSTVRHELQLLADSLGYDSENGHFGTEADEMIPPAERGTLRDLSSRGRIDLVLQTNMRQCANYGRMIQGSTEMALYQFPCWELKRIYPRMIPRGLKLQKGAAVPDPGEDWPSRWQACGGVFYGGGRMIARKDDPIWSQLGSRSLFSDGLDAPFPPFAFNSGFGWMQIPRDQAIALGVIEKGEKVSPPKGVGLNDGVQVSTSRFSKELLAEALKELRAEIEGDKLRMVASKATQLANSLGQSRDWHGRFAADAGGGSGDSGNIGKTGTWESMGLPSVEKLPPSEALDTCSPGAARRLIQRGSNVTDRLGNKIRIDENILEHWEQKKLLLPGQEHRLRRMREVIATLKYPSEIWQQGKQRMYFGVFQDEKRHRYVAGFTIENNRMRTFFHTGKVRDANDYRKGTLLYEK